MNHFLDINPFLTITIILTLTVYDLELPQQSAVNVDADLIQSSNSDELYLKGDIESFDIIRNE